MICSLRGCNYEREAGRSGVGFFRAAGGSVLTGACGINTAGSRRSEQYSQRLPGPISPAVYSDGPGSPGCGALPDVQKGKSGPKRSDHIMGDNGDGFDDLVSFLERIKPDLDDWQEIIETGGIP